uniref:Uncharacterized protein n=1 Tax=Panagrolaimus sp. JU765 TaxID=591449 RepID=A0AC34RQ60_9BILA
MECYADFSFSGSIWLCARLPADLKPPTVPGLIASILKRFSHCYEASFKDSTVLKKLSASLIMVLRDSNTNITFTKKIIVLLTRLYPLVLQWLASKTNDNEADYANVYLMRFIEMIVIGVKTQPLTEKESKELKMLIFKRLLECEMNLTHAIQRKSLYKSLIYMVSRRCNELTPKMEEQLMNFIINDQDKRADLIFLWLAELYSQWKGFTICVRDGPESVTFTESENHQRYDMLLVDFLRKLYAIEGHKNDLFHDRLAEKTVPPFVIAFIHQQKMNFHLKVQ